MALSFVGMMVAVAGYLPPVAGAVAQEVIDVAAVLNALRVAFPVENLTDFSWVGGYRVWTACLLVLAQS